MIDNKTVNKRSFVLPLEQLSIEQKKIRLLPLEGQHLVVGAPGTGKSILALLRAKILHEEKKDYVFLAYNHPLIQANNQLFGDGLKQQQWQSWFCGMYRTLFKNNPPQLEPYIYDWEQILSQLAQLGEQALKETYIIIDEGQDMPVGFYQFLAALGYENFFVVADQNQRINEKANSSVQDLQNCLALERDDVHELTHNYRNSHAIARFAQLFYHDPASPRPALPKQEGLAKPALYRYAPDRLSNIIDRLMMTVKNHPNDLFALIAFTAASRNALHKRLDAAAKNQGLALPVCYGGKKEDAEQLDFTQGGMMVMSAQACKGLEFDRVILWDIDECRSSENGINQLKKLLYVASSRAKKQLILFAKQDTNSAALQILPNDDDIFSIKQL